MPSQTDRIEQLEAEIKDLKSQLGLLLGVLHLKEAYPPAGSATSVAIMKALSTRPGNIRLIYERTVSGFQIKTIIDPWEEPKPEQVDAWSLIISD